MLLIKIILYVLLALFILLLMVLIIPFDYQAKGEYGNEKKLSFKVLWLFGLVTFSGSYSPVSGMIGAARLFGFKIKLDMNSLKVKEKKPKGSKPEKKKSPRKRTFRPGSMDRETFFYIIGSMRKLLRHILPRSVEAQGVLGFEDPYYTGLACIVLENLRGLHLHKIRIRYVFYDEVYEGQFRLAGRIRLIYAAYVTLRVLVKKPVRKLIFQ